MKKCPFCAEEIKDEAIVCRYCGRDLPQPPSDVNVTSQPPQQVNIASKPKPSVWKQGAKVAAIFTVLAAIGSFVRYQRAPVELIGSLTIGSVANFLFWWLVVTGIIAAWRKSKVLLIVLCFVVGVGLIILMTLINGNTSFTLFPIQTPTSTPRPTPTTEIRGNVIIVPNSLSCENDGKNIVIKGQVSQFFGRKTVRNVVVIGWLCDELSCYPKNLPTEYAKVAPTEIASNLTLIDFVTPEGSFDFQVEIPLDQVPPRKNVYCDASVLRWDE